MDISTIIQSVTVALDNVRSILAPLPGLLLLCTCARRPGFSSLLTTANVCSEIDPHECDNVLKAFIYNVIDKLKKNLHADAVCWVVIPPSELKFTLAGANAGGHVAFTGENVNFIQALAIIR